MTKRKEKVCWKIKFLLLVCAILSCWILPAQELQFSIKQGGAISFKGNIFCYGIKSSKTQDQICIYKISTDLKSVADSLIYTFSGNNTADYLPVNADTLHGQLNIYCQAVGNNSVNILRCDAFLKNVDFTKNIEIGRLNNSAIFNKEKLMTEESVFDLRQVTDSGGIQFYLNKYDLKQKTGNYDYLFRWQFPFDKKDIKEVKIIKADKRFVYVAVSRLNQTQHSLWLLRLQSSNGILSKALRLDNKETTGSYQFGALCFDPQSKTMTLCGQKTNSKNKKLQVWICKADSNLEVLEKKEFGFDLLNINAKSPDSDAIILFKQIAVLNNSNIYTISDLYIKEGTCYYYSNTQELNFNQTENGLVQLQKNLNVNKDLLYYYRSPDKTDMNGKNCSPDFQIPIMPVLLDCSFDGTAAYLLQKKLLRKKNVNISTLSLINKQYQCRSIQDFQTEQIRSVNICKDHQFVVGLQTEEGRFLLRLFNW